MHHRAVAVALDIRIEPLLVTPTPAHGAHLGTRDRPIPETVQFVFRQAGIFVDDEIDESET